MKKRILKIVGWVAALSLILGLGAAVGGGIVYAATRNRDSISFTFQADDEEPFPSEPGIVIAAVLSDGPADAAGVVRGDILLQLDGQAVNDAAELLHVLGERAVGDEVKLAILHGDDERTIEVTLGERDDVAYLGVVPCAGIPISGQRMSIHVVEPDVKPGATILDVVPDSPADRAGLQAGDIVVAVDGQELDAENDLADLIAAHEPGDTVTLEVEQPGEEPRQITVELGEHPDEEGTAYLGVRYQPTRRFRVLGGPDFSFGERRGEREFPLPVVPHIDIEGLDGEIVQGAVVEDVREDSPAEEAGLRQGDLITAIEGDPVKGPADLADAIAERKPGDQITLTVLHLDGDDHEEREIEVTLAEHPDEEGAAYLGLRVGGFAHIQRFAGDGEDVDLDLFINPKAPFDELEDFEFHFQPEHLDCCGQSI